MSYIAAYKITERKLSQQFTRPLSRFRAKDTKRGCASAPAGLQKLGMRSSLNSRRRGSAFYLAPQPIRILLVECSSAEFETDPQQM